MSKKNLPAPAIFLALFTIFLINASAQSNYSLNFRERFVIQSVRLIHSAEATYQATIGAGTYGSLAQLREAGYIDAALATGQKHGYILALTVTHPTATTGAKFILTATPPNYPKSGRRSFYIDEFGVMRGADKKGALADVNDPSIDDCALFGMLANERCAIYDMRTLVSAEVTYYTTVGGGNYGGFPALFAAGLINSRIASGTNHGYTYVWNIQPSIPGFPAFFSFRATPVSYGITGVRSFYIDVTGVMRGADKQGQPANENDPPIND
jgi:hypothetical protein